MRYEVFVLTHHSTHLHPTPLCTRQGLYLDPPEGRKRQTVCVNTGVIIVKTDESLLGFNLESTGIMLNCVDK